MSSIHTLLLIIVTMAVSLQARAESYFVHTPHSSNELTNNDVNAVAQDKYGRIWIATEEGLNIYDGTHYEQYYKVPGEGLAANELSMLIDDREESVMWIATQHKGINAYDYRTGKVTHYAHKDGDPQTLTGNSATKMRHAQGGRLWVCSYVDGIDLFDTKTGKVVDHYNQKTVKGLKSNSVWDVADDGNGHLYVGHVDGRLSVIDISQRTAVTYEPPQMAGMAREKDVRCLAIGGDGMVYMGTYYGIVRFNPSTRTFSGIASSVPGVHVYDIQITQDNYLIAATELHGLMYMNMSQNAPTPHMLTEAPLASSTAGLLDRASVRCVMVDRNRNVWAGLWGRGLYVVNNRQRPFMYMPYNTTMPSAEDVTSQSVLSMTFSHTEQLWLGTDGGGVNVFSGKRRTGVMTAGNSALGGNSVQAVMTDSRGNVWTGSYISGLCMAPKGGGALRQVFTGADAQIDVRTLKEWPGRGVLIGTSSGLYMADYDGRIVKHMNIGNQLVRALAIDGKERVWVGMYDNGVILLDSTWKQVRHMNDELPSNVVNDLMCDSRGNIWIGTNDGLIMAPQGDMTKAQTTQREQGLSNSHIRAITEDAKGRIWVSTSKGISCMNNGQVYNFGKREGIRTGYFIDRAVATAANGDIYFGSVDGVCYFSPEATLEKVQGVRLTVNGVHTLGADDMPALSIMPGEGEEVTTTYDASSVVIGFNTDNLAESNNYDYFFRIPEMGEAWHNVTEPGMVQLRGLRPGTYTVEIGMGKYGNEPQVTTQITITVTPPIWRTWWAYALYMLILGMVIWEVVIVYRRRMNERTQRHLRDLQHEQEKDLNNERLRFFTNITHELRTPLTMILGPLADLEADKTLPQMHARRIKTINDSAKRLLVLVNQLLDFRKTETQNKKLEVGHGNIVALVNEIALRYKELNRNPKVEYEVQTAESKCMMWFDTDVITSIVNNLLNNATKYTPEGRITVSMSTAMVDGEECMCIAVADTGYGIGPDDLPHIFDRYYQAKNRLQASGTGIGLALVKSLAELHNGKIKVESKPGEGSTFTLVLHKNYDYPDALHKAPVVTAPAAETVQTDADDTTDETTSNKPLLLVVEDNDEIREYIAQSLEADADIIMAADGQEGLNMATDRLPDIVVTDVMMPVMDGIEMCQKLKKDVRTSHIPIIMLTAKDTMDDQEEGYQSGVDSYLTKPFSISMLRSRIFNLIESRRLLASAFMQNALKLPQQKQEEPAPTPQPAGTDVMAKPEMSVLDRKFVEDLAEFVEKNISSDKLDISMLCDHFCMSTSSLYRKIKSLTGVSGNVFIRNMRLKHAAHLMMEQGVSVTEAAYSCGFGDVNYFRQCFKDEYGISAAEYAKGRGKS